MYLYQIYLLIPANPNRQTKLLATAGILAPRITAATSPSLRKPDFDPSRNIVGQQTWFFIRIVSVVDKRKPVKIVPVFVHCRKNIVSNYSIFCLCGRFSNVSMSNCLCSIHTKSIRSADNSVHSSIFYQSQRMFIEISECSEHHWIQRLKTPVFTSDSRLIKDMHRNIVYDLSLHFLY